MLKKIYKYHKVNSYLYDIIENNQLYFAKPHELNDPFDAWLRVGPKYINQKAEEAFELFLKEDPETEKYLRLYSREGLFQKFMDHYLAPKSIEKKQLAGYFNSSFRLCCFTSKPLSELMWAHYGGQSTGICLEFDATIPPLPEKLMKVKYSNELIFTNGDMVAFDVVTTKRKPWSYESEYRCIGPDVPLVSFEKRMLVGIIFGHRTSENSEREICKLFKKGNYDNIKFKKVVMKPQTGEIFLSDYAPT